MSITSAMFAGVSGMSANSTALAAISDNIANMNTVGYKRSAAQFTNLVAAITTPGTYGASGSAAAGDAMPPGWVIWSCYLAIGAGTLFGGWRIVKTMGQRITKLKPVGGFCAETGGALTLFLATGLGIPVSTTHTITGAIVGVGAVRNASKVRWGVAGNIVWAWVLTIPASALVAAISYFIGRALF